MNFMVHLVCLLLSYFVFSAKQACTDASDNYIVTDNQVTWFQAKNMCKLAGGSVMTVSDTGEVKSTANLSDIGPFIAWVDAYKVVPHVILNTGCHLFDTENNTYYIEDSENEPRACAAKCSLTEAVALQGNRCYCLDGIKLSKTDIEDCNHGCPGDGSKICGNVNKTSIVSVYKIINMSKEICPCLLTRRDGRDTFEIYHVNCSINLYYLCAPENNKEFKPEDIVDQYNSQSEANSLCSDGLAELYHADYNFGNALKAGPSYWIQFIRGLTVIIEDANTQVKPEKCFAYVRDNERSDQIIEQPCLSNLTSLCQDKGLGDVIGSNKTITTTTTTSTSETLSELSVSSYTTMSSALFEYNKKDHHVVVIVVIFLLIISLLFKVSITVFSGIQRNGGNSSSKISGITDDNRGTEDSGAKDFFHKNKNSCAKTDLEIHRVRIEKSENKTQKEMDIEKNIDTEGNEKEIELNEYSELNVHGKRGSVIDEGALYDCTKEKDETYNILSLKEKHSEFPVDDTYDHTGIQSSETVYHITNSNSNTTVPKINHLYYSALEDIKS